MSTRQVTLQLKMNTPEELQAANVLLMLNGAAAALELGTLNDTKVIPSYGFVKIDVAEHVPQAKIDRFVKRLQNRPGSIVERAYITEQLPEEGKQ